MKSAWAAGHVRWFIKSDIIGVLLLFLPLLVIVYHLIGDITFEPNKA
jgi:hypothetical protein